LSQFWCGIGESSWSSGDSRFAGFQIPEDWSPKAFLESLFLKIPRALNGMGTKINECLPGAIGRESRLHGGHRCPKDFGGRQAALKNTIFVAPLRPPN
jgi:hypothetical protein